MRQPVRYFCALFALLTMCTLLSSSMYAQKGSSASPIWIRSPAVVASDTTKPTNTVNVVHGLPTQAVFTIRDTGSGLASIVVTQSDNADTPTPSFTSGTTNTVTVTSTKIDQSQPFTIGLKVSDVAGNVNSFVVAVGAQAGQLIISEFRVRGPNGANDEFVELYNNTNAAITVATTDGSAGYALVASNGVARFTVPNGTVIPARGHYLGVNSVGYSLASSPAGNGTTATGDITYATDIADNAGIALFNTATVANFTLANRLDAVGSTSEANTLYKEGTGYPALTPFSIDYAFVRDTCGKGGSITILGPCPIAGVPKDTDNNAADFIFVDTNGTSAGAGQRLGTPGPENLSSPIQRNASVPVLLLDSTLSTGAIPNRVRDFTSDPANNSTFGTLDIRRRVVNSTGANVTRLRFRVIDITTFPAPSGFADLRPRTSTSVVVSGINDVGTCAATGAPTTAPCTVTVQGTTLEQPPSQPNGGGFNSSMSAGTVTLGTPLANGASVNVRFLIGIQQTGTFKFFINVEALP